MYDLPSENLEEPGLPDEFHDLQPHLLSRTLRLTAYPFDRFFTGSDLNLYYDGRHPQWYKRPDWFLALDVPRLYEGTELRSSYVVWQESVDPFVVVELLSPGTEQEDLGQLELLGSEFDSTPADTPADMPAEASKTKPPRKWEVYERILRVPYYCVFSRYNSSLHFFQLVGGRYQEQALNAENPRAWIPELQVGLGIWQGTFEGIARSWLRWYDQQGDWIPTDTEQERQAKELAQALVTQEQQARQQALERAEQVEAQLRQVALNLLQTGMPVSQVAQLTGLSEAQIAQLQQQ
jgi:Uma2 family endonuclease